MPNLVGIGLSQVPTNSMLGGMAYQDPEHASIKDLDLKNLSQINAEIADTAVDVFVYDTRKDSDGGAWRKRTQHTSWYNETLNTSTRGSRKEFPAVAVIVADATTDKVTIYDGDDPDLPMWMVFSAVNPRGILGWSSNNYTRFKVAALNGILATATNDGGHLFKFIEDFVEINYGSTNYPLTSSRTIEGRNEPAAYISGGGATRTNVVLTYNQNDVAMTVLPNAPIDSATGLPVPTIAVATDGGTSVIKDDGTVVDFNDALGSSRPVSTVVIRGNDIVHWNINNGTIQQFFDALSATSDSTNDAKYNYTAGGGHATCENVSALLRNSGNGPYYLAVRDSKSIAAAAQSGMSVFVDGVDRSFSTNTRTISDSRVAYITSDYNTGWMHGDIKGAFLSDTDTTNAVGTELVTNGTFNTNVSGWTDHNSTLTLSSNKMNVSVPSGTGYASQSITTVNGGRYVLSFYGSNNSSSFNARISGVSYSGTDIANLGWGIVTGYHSHTFTATSTTTYITFGVANGNIDVDNVSVRLAEEDRSVNNKGLQVFGTVTKTPVATGAELVAYSGWNITSGNYLEQPYNSDLNFGTGDYYISVWVRQTYNQSSHSQNYVFNRVDRSGGSVNGARFELRVPSNLGNFRFYQSDGSNISYSDSSGNSFLSATWTHVVCGRNGDNLPIYINGRYDTASLSGDSNVKNSLNNTSAKLFMGGEHQDNNNPWGGDIALFRIGAGFPSDEQIKKIYDDEKHLFHENAKATLYGSSDAVTALAFDDDTNLLHVGTSAGRSEFQGLRRINNTTDAVTTAISASNGLVAEQ